MIKIKQTKKDTYTIKGLNDFHLEAIYTLLMHTRLGNGIYENAATELLVALEETDLPNVVVEACTLDVTFIEDTPIINLSHYND